ncbi:MAG: hypothetical protein OEW39_02825 [Deltaproteobacteria bacterium]|nr:hypothetical protein [Deltaproteobacteria bacterium]
MGKTNRHLKPVLQSLVYLGVAAIAALGGVSCMGGDTLSGPESKTTLYINGTSGMQVALNGDWTRPCNYDPVLLEAVQTKMTIDGSGFTTTQSVFADANCSGTASKVYSRSGTFVLGEEVAVAWLDADGGKNPPPGVTAQSATTRINTEATATLDVSDPALILLYNTAKHCQFEDWKVGIAKNIAGCVEEDMPILPDTFTAYEVIDDSGIPLKWYSGRGFMVGTVNSFDPLLR